jgi:hypothetical protein
MGSIAVNMHPTNAEDARTSALRHMTAEQFLNLGVEQVVYLRGGVCDGEKRFVLFGADGAPLARTDAVEAAVEVAVAQGLKFISVH